MLLNIGGNLKDSMTSEELNGLINKIIFLSIKSFFQTGKLPISGEKILDVGQISLPEDIAAFPDIVSLYYQYSNFHLKFKVFLLFRLFACGYLLLTATIYN